jgi:hypothetical protein
MKKQGNKFRYLWSMVKWSSKPHRKTFYVFCSIEKFIEGLLVHEKLHREFELRQLLVMQWISISVNFDETKIRIQTTQQCGAMASCSLCWEFRALSMECCTTRRERYAKILGVLPQPLEVICIWFQNKMPQELIFSSWKLKFESCTQKHHSEEITKQAIKRKIQKLLFLI